MKTIKIKLGRSRAVNMSFLEFLCMADIISSRKEATKLIENGEIKVNGKVVKSANFNFSALESFELTVGSEWSCRVKVI